MRATQNALRHGDARKGCVSRLHNIWRGMLKRCNPNLAKPHGYALRGIAVCDEWLCYEAFRDWSKANGYAADLTIERRDNDGSYAPGNCAWVTRTVQARNRRTSRTLTLGDRTQTIAAWAEEVGISQGLLHARVFRLKWDVRRALTSAALPIKGRPKRMAA